MEVAVENKQFYYRLIALWAVCEGTLGGIIHGFQLPITGLIVGSSAVIIICLIGYYVPQKGAILKATLLVAVFKMMLSPHSPIGAYYAVFFQGVMGEIFFYNKKYYKSSCILFATVALLESGAQAIIVATLIYGIEFWKAVNKFISNLTGNEVITNYSLYIGGFYLLLHLIVGILIGILAAKIPTAMPRWRKEHSLFAEDFGVTATLNPEKIPIKKKTKSFRNVVFIIWIFLILLWLQDMFSNGKGIIASHQVIYILIRSFLILFTWYFLLGPFLLSILKKWLSKQKSKFNFTIQEILLLIPATNHIVKRSWEISSHKKRIKRLNLFFKIVLVNALLPQYNIPPNNDKQNV